MVLLFGRYSPQKECNEAQKKYLTVLAANDKIQAFKWKRELWNIYLLHHALPASQYLFTSDEVNDDINLGFLFYVIMKWVNI